MRIVSREEFLAMPPGTVYYKYQDECLGDLCIKGDTVYNSDDFFMMVVGDIKEAEQPVDDIIFKSDRLYKASKSGESIPIESDQYLRDACFDGNKAKFAVWEEQDIRGLIGVLKKALRSVQVVTWQSE